MAYLGLESVRHGTTGACIKDIMQLHFSQAEIVADLTWGKGRFWHWPRRDKSEGEVRLPRVIGLEIERLPGLEIQSDYRHIPLKDQSVDVAVFDPPFIFTRGVRRISGTKRGFLGSEGVEQIGSPKNSEELRSHTRKVFNEAHRIARNGMVLKGQDLVTGQDVNWWAYQTMYDIEYWHGLLPYDMLIQVSPAARLKDPRWKNQYHFRRRHVLYLVYKW